MRRAVAAGVAKVNVNTEVRERTFAMLGSRLDELSRGWRIAELDAAIVAAVEEVVAEKLELLGGRKGEDRSRATSCAWRGPSATPSRVDDRTIGRAAFLGVARGRHRGAVLRARRRSALVGKVVAGPGGSARSRRAAGGSTRSAAGCRTSPPAAVPAADRRSRRAASHARRSPTCARCHGQSRCPTSTASPAGRSTTFAGAASGSTT